MGNKSKHWTNKVNGWVFLSHSYKDSEHVKVIRDYLVSCNSTVWSNLHV